MNITDLLPVSVRLDDDKNCLVILDQTLLPSKEVYLSLYSQKEIWEAINKLQIRGAPAIGIASAFGAYLGIKALNTDDSKTLYDKYQSIKEYLNSSRPTAVNLSWALNEIDKCILANIDNSVEDIKNSVLYKANEILENDIKTCQTIGELGLSLLNPNDGILTHCNAGQIATSRLGTALAPIILGQSKGFNFKVFADETRPLLQGARLTAYELMKANVDVTLICDNMASIVMNNRWVQAILVGADRIAANGDTANKIGTSNLAILAQYYDIPIYVCAPTSTIDMQTKEGKDIVIEERCGDEIRTMWYANQITPENVKCYNPAFDVTNNELITAIITEKGILYKPFKESISNLNLQKT